MIKNINGLNINYIIKGEGKPVVLLHGWGSNISLFLSMTELISKKYKVIAMDLPGFGKSEEPKTPWSVDNYVDFVIDFLSNLGITQAILLGHSFGGRIIIKMFSRKDLPFNITDIILTGSAGVLPKKSTKQKIKVKIYKITKNIYSNKLVKKVFPNALENLRNKNGSADYIAASPIMRQTLVKVVNEDLVPLFENINIPTLLIWGKNDTATPLEDGKLMNSKMKESALVVLENSGHYAFLDEMFAFNKILAAYLKIEV